MPKVIVHCSRKHYSMWDVTVHHRRRRNLARIAVGACFLPDSSSFSATFNHWSYGLHQQLLIGFVPVGQWLPFLCRKWTRWNYCCPLICFEHPANRSLQTDCQTSTTYQSSLCCWFVVADRLWQPSVIVHWFLFVGFFSFVGVRPLSGMENSKMEESLSVQISSIRLT